MSKDTLLNCTLFEKGFLLMDGIGIRQIKKDSCPDLLKARYVKDAFHLLHEAIPIWSGGLVAFQQEREA